jgi:hypothetical protein
LTSLVPVAKFNRQSRPRCPLVSVLDGTDYKGRVAVDVARQGKG